MADGGVAVTWHHGGVTANEWLDDDARERGARHQRAADVSKVLATLVAVGAAVLVAVALASESSGSGRVAVLLLGGCVALGLLVAVMDRRVAVDVPAVLERSRLYEWDDARLLGELRVLHTAALDVNESAVKAAAWVLGAEVLVAVAAGVAALVALA